MTPSRGAARGGAAGGGAAGGGAAGGGAAGGGAAGGEFVSIVEVDGRPDATSDALVGVPDSDLMQRWPWWRNAPGAMRAVAVLAATGAVVALGSSVLAATASHRIVGTVRTVSAPAPIAGVDARGCPVGRSCLVRISSAVAAVRRDSFADATGVDIYDSASPAKPVARYLSATFGVAHLRVTSTCDARRLPAAVDEAPRTGALLRRGQASPSGRDRAGSDPAGSDPAGSDPAGRNTALVTEYYTRHDTVGCTVQVTCSYPVPASAGRLGTVVDSCAEYVDRVGMDAAVYL